MKRVSALSSLPWLRSYFHTHNHQPHNDNTDNNDDNNDEDNNNKDSINVKSTDNIHDATNGFFDSHSHPVKDSIYAIPPRLQS